MLVRTREAAHSLGLLMVVLIAWGPRVAAAQPMAIDTAEEFALPVAAAAPAPRLSVSNSQGNNRRKPALVGPEIEVTVQQASSAVNGGANVYIRVANHTERTIHLTNLSLRFSPAVVAARNQEELRDASVDLGDRKELGGGMERFLSFAIQPSRASFSGGVSGMLGNWDLLTFLPGDYPVQAILSYQFVDHRGGDARVVIDMALDPPLAALVAGGVLGAFLLGLFSETFAWIRHRQRVAAGATAPGTGFFKRCGRFIAMGMGGSISAVILVVLLKRTDAAQLPVSITVLDFYGGIVLGLFSFKAGDALYSRLFAGEQDPRPTVGGNVIGVQEVDGATAGNPTADAQQPDAGVGSPGPLVPR